METKVVNVRVKHIRPTYENLKEWMKNPDNIYIGRGRCVFIDGVRFPPEDSMWANPFKVCEFNDKTIELYKKYILKKIKSGTISCDDLKKLKNKNLGCWCKPKACHGDVLKELVDSL